MNDILKRQISNAVRTAVLSGKQPPEFVRTVYFVLERSRMHDEVTVDLATSFKNEDDAYAAAGAKNASAPLEGDDEWTASAATFFRLDDGRWVMNPASRS